MEQSNTIHPGIKYNNKCKKTVWRHNSNTKDKPRTNKTNIVDTIRQGGDLAVVEFANMMDEITKELEKKELYDITIGETKTTGCLL